MQSLKIPAQTGKAFEVSLTVMACEDHHGLALKTAQRSVMLTLISSFSSVLFHLDPLKVLVFLWFIPLCSDRTQGITHFSYKICSM